MSEVFCFWDKLAVSIGEAEQLDFLLLFGCESVFLIPIYHRILSSIKRVQPSHESVATLKPVPCTAL